MTSGTLAFRWLTLSLALSLMLSLAAQGQLPLLTTLKRQPAAKTGRPTASKSPWVVYSDRDANPTYREPALSAQFQQLRFREACYVLAERKGFLRLVQYDPALKIGTFYAARMLKNRKAVRYLGWVPKTQLLLASQAPADSGQTRPTLYCPALSSSRMLRGPSQFLRHDSLQLFAQPNLTGPLARRLRLYDLAYVYKFSESGTEALLGATTWVQPDSAATRLLGWAPTTALQPVGQGWFVEPARPVVPNWLHRSPGGARQTERDSLAPARAFGAVPWASREPRLPVLARLEQPGLPAVAQLGLLTPLLEASNSVLSVNGHLITSQQAANWRDKARQYNVVYVLEDSPAMRPYWSELVSAVQATGAASQDSARYRTYRLGAVVYHAQGAAAKNKRATRPVVSTGRLVRDPALVTEWLGQHQPRDVPDARGYSQPIQEALESAFRLLTSHDGENNLVVLVGIGGDNSDVAQRYTVRKGLRQAEARMLCFQVKAPPDTIANNFVLQAEELVLQSALEVGLVKRGRLASPRLVVPTPVYALRAGSQNVYHLDFPRQSMVPGWVLFPTKGHRLPISLLLATTDSLLTQMTFDARQTQASLDRALAIALQQHSYLAAQVNRTLLARLEAPVPGSTQSLYALRNYPFYQQAYTLLGPEQASLRQLRLLTPDTYAALGRWLEQLAADDLNPARPRDQARLAASFRQLGRQVAAAHADTASLAYLLSELLELPVRHPLLAQLRLRSLDGPDELPAGVWKRLLYLLRERRDFYRRVPTLPGNSFISNGYTYYWLSEDLFR